MRGMEVQLQSFLTSALDGGEGLTALLLAKEPPTIPAEQKAGHYREKTICSCWESKPRLTIL
jgi:hypothetical protein